MNSFYLRFVIPVAPRTKKNHQRIIWNKQKHAPMVLPSQEYKAYEEECSIYVPRQKQPIDFPVNVKALFYMPTRRKVDLNNLEAALADILVKYRVIEDDNMMILTTWNGSEVHYGGKDTRTEVEITKSDVVFEEHAEAQKKSRNDSKLYTAHGKTMTIREWADDLGVTLSCLRKRLASGMPYDKVFTPDKRAPGGYIGREKRRRFSQIEKQQKEKELNKEDDDKTDIFKARKGTV